MSGMSANLWVQQEIKQVPILMGFEVSSGQQTVTYKVK
jgi:hypothetical protein